MPSPNSMKLCYPGCSAEGYAQQEILMKTMALNEDGRSGNVTIISTANTDELSGIAIIRVSK